MPTRRGFGLRWLFLIRRRSSVFASYGDEYSQKQGVEPCFCLSVRHHPTPYAKVTHRAISVSHFWAFSELFALSSLSLADDTVD